MKKITFKDYDLTLELGSLVNIIGSSASGKTRMLKTLINKETGNILIDDEDIKTYNIDFLKKNIAACFYDLSFNTPYVKDELLYYQDKVSVNEKDANTNLLRFSNYFKINDILDKKIDELTKYDQVYIKILSLLIINPTIFGIDDLFVYLTLEKRERIIKYAESNNITILNVTSNSEDLLFDSTVVIIDNNHAILNNSNKYVLAQEKFLNKIGMNLPFIAQLSSDLNYYDLLKENFSSDDRLIGEIWK